jgi:hypothetical protein
LSIGVALRNNRWAVRGRSLLHLEKDLKSERSSRDREEMDPQREAAYWREQHPNQAYAKNYLYEQFEHAYRTGYTSFLKNPAKKFREVEHSVAAEYEQGKPDAALPWARSVPR